MILIELLIATTLVSMLLIALGVMRRLRGRKAATLLIQKIKEDEGRRITETKKILSHKFGFDDETAAKIAVKISHGERTLYQEVINFYLRRAPSGLENLNLTFEGAVDPYRTLDPPGRDGSGKSPGDAKEMQRLKEENKRLSEEIGVTMQTMGRMLSEYSAMFSQKAEDAAKEITENAKSDEDSVPGDDHAEEAAQVEMQDSEAKESQSGDEGQAEDSSDAASHLGGKMVEEMDDLSDLDPQEDKDLQDIKAPDNPNELLG